MTEDERVQAVAGLRGVLNDIEQGRVEATVAQRAYIAGALHALEEQS